MLINGVELGEFDVYDIDKTEVFDNALSKVLTTIKEVSADETPQSAKLQFNAVVGFVDTLFGKGSYQKAHGDKKNLVQALDAFEIIVTQIMLKRLV